MKQTSTVPRRRYYGWTIVGAILALLTFATGLSFYNHAVILNALARQPAFTVQSASVAVSLFFLSSGITGLWVARLVHDYDPRLCISFGAVVAGCSLAALSQVSNVWQLYIVYFMFGAGFSATNLIPATSLVTRWFHKRRAMALSIASTGLSLGGVLVTPMCALLVEKIGLQQAAPVMGAVYVIGVVPIAVIWLRPSPESMGLKVDGGDLEPLSPSAEPGDVTPDGRVLPLPAPGLLLEGMSFRDARRGRLFWGISLAYIFLMLAQVGGISHQYGLARELLSEAQTAMVVAILPIASIVGRLAGGWIVEQVSIRGFAIGMMILQMVSLGLLATGLGVATLCMGLGLFGITVGNLLMLQPLLVAEAFGIRDYPRIFAASNFMSSWGTACGPMILGLIYAASDNVYWGAYVFAAAAGLLGLLLFLAGGKVERFR